MKTIVVFDSSTWNKDLGVEISNGTFREQDLLPLFVNMLQGARSIQSDVVSRYEEYVKAVGDDDHSFWGSSQAQDMREELEDVIHRLTPDGWRFGSHEGSSSCIGFWWRNEDGRY